MEYDQGTGRDVVHIIIGVLYRAMLLHREETDENSPKT
jgi:hypothetical protein